MLVFQQTPETFSVSEELLYQPSGEGEHVFVKIRKQGISTMRAKRRLSESSGVSMRWIGHAGMKDSLACAEQWFSWPVIEQRAKPVSLPELEILEITRHQNKLSIGHVRNNHFRMTLTGNASLPSEEQLTAAFPNFYGRQRFGSNIDVDVAELLTQKGKQRDILTVLQSRLLNSFVRHRLKTTGRTASDDELWTNSNGKRWFRAEMDQELEARYATCEISPTAPIFGYKVQLRPVEERYLAEYDLDSASFRRWGKMARGARRPMFVKAQLKQVEQQDNCQILSFSLPAGVYATVYLTHLYTPGLLVGAEAGWPNFTQPVELVS